MPRGPRISFNLGLDQNIKKPSAIDRFCWSKSGKLYGYASNSWMIGGFILGIVHSIAAIVFLILSATVRGFPNVLTLIFSIAAVLSVSGTLFAYRRSRKTGQSEIRISAGGRKLLYKIGQHIGWRDNDAFYYNRGNQWATWWMQLVGQKTASNVMTLRGAEILEEGCSEYNRISGLLKLAMDSKGRSSTISPQIQVASDEAIISLINQVALLEDTPETATAIISQCHMQIDKLSELGDRFEEMLTGPVTLADRLSSTTVMDSVLDQLRMEAQAHEELRIMDHHD
jgi:hypothetical protein